MVAVVGLVVCAAVGAFVNNHDDVDGVVGGCERNYRFAIDAPLAAVVDT